VFCIKYYHFSERKPNRTLIVAENKIFF